MKIIINPVYSFLSDFIKSLPETFKNSGEEIYKARNTLKRFVIENEDFVVKSFREPILINRIAYTFFRPSKASRSYKHSFELLRHGILTPDPIAYIEIKYCGLLKDSYFISRNMSKAKTLRAFTQGEDVSPRFIRALAKYLVKLHDEGVHHIDLSPGNILYETDNNNNYSFYLVDINRMRFNKHFDMKARARNFDRLAINYETSSELAREYSFEAGYPEKEFVELVNKYTDYFYYTRSLKTVARNYRKAKGSLLASLFGPVMWHSLLCFASKFTGEKSAPGRKLFAMRENIYDKYFRIEDYRGGMARMFGYI